MKSALRILSFTFTLLALSNLSWANDSDINPGLPTTQDWGNHFELIGKRYALAIHLANSDPSRENLERVYDAYYDYLKLRDELEAKLKQQLYHSKIEGHSGLLSKKLAGFLEARGFSVENFRELESFEFLGASSQTELSPWLKWKLLSLNSIATLLTVFNSPHIAKLMGANLGTQDQILAGLVTLIAFNLLMVPSRVFNKRGTEMAFKLEELANAENAFWIALQNNGISLPATLKSKKDKVALLKAMNGTPISPDFFDIDSPEFRTLADTRDLIASRSAGPSRFNVYQKMFSRKGLGPESPSIERPEIEFIPKSRSNEPYIWLERRLIHLLDRLYPHLLDRRYQPSKFKNSPLGNFLESIHGTVHVSVREVVEQDQRYYAAFLQGMDKTTGIWTTYEFRYSLPSMLVKAQEVSARLAFWSTNVGEKVENCSVKIKGISGSNPI